MEKVLKEMQRAFFTDEEVDREKGFDCVKCGKHTTPARGQWIFYKLCDECFAEFDAQKMKGRIGYYLEGKKVKWFESAEEWIKETKK